jgi:outer membrane protein assembly factor BamB
MKDNKLKRSIVIVGITIIFMGSTITPIIFGQFDSIQEENMTREYLDPNFFNSYHRSESLLYKLKLYTSSTQPLNEFHTQTIDEIKKDITSTVIASGSMDSPWPMYCHDTHHTGRSPYSTSENPPGVMKWIFDTHKPSFFGSTVIDSNRTIYTYSYNLYALYPNGTIKWQFDADGWGESCPVIDINGNIYIANANADHNYIYAIYPNGTMKWRYYTGDNVFSSPAIGSDGTIYCGCGQSILALNPNGTKRWQHSTGHLVYSSPAIGDDGTVYCGCHDTYLYALYPNNGTEQWKFHTGDWIRVSPAIANDGTIYCVSLDGYLYAVRPNGTMKWQTWVEAGTSPTIGQDGTIYAGWSQLNAVNPLNGSVKWTFNTGGCIQGGTPCTSNDGTIYFGTSSGGDFIAVNSDGTEAWRAPIGKCESAPSIGEDGTIYVGGMDNNDDGHLYAFGSGPLKAEAYGPYTAMINQQVYLTGTIFGGLPPYASHWDFGDGNTSVEQNPIHIYTNVGNFTVTFSVTDSEGNQSTDSSYVIVSSPPPLLTIKKPENGIYFRDNKVVRFSRPIIIGSITIQADATQEPFGINSVEFYIDDALKATDTEIPYQWTWATPTFFKHTIKVIAYDTSGKSTGKSIGVSKFF